MGQRKTPRPKAGSLSLTSDVGDLPLHLALRCAVDFMEGLDTPRSLAVALLIRYGEFSDLVKLKCDPRDYQHACDFRKDYAATKYVSKLKGLIPDTILEEVALRSFKAAEDRCASTNIRLSNGYPLPGAEHLIYRIRGKISRILGELNLADVLGLCRWGPGATATLKGDDVRPENKILEPRLSVTRRLYRLARAVVGADVHWCRARLGPSVEGPCSLLSSEFQWVDYMRVVTVEKDSKTKRTIGAEPTLNTYVQQGIGRYIRKRLRIHGVNLDDQTVNQELARLALELGFATVDLSSASDLISYRLVEELLPRDWFELLDMARSGYALMPGSKKSVPLEKFSSMGNGYTFELESLIFYAIAQAVTEEVGASPRLVSVYGDDIILPAVAYSRLCEVFQLFGFRVNLDKSYAGGLFYESCGEHFFNGVSVTPVYQKEQLNDLPELIRAANRLVRWASSGTGVVAVERSVEHARQNLLTVASSSLGDHPLPSIPWGVEGDDGFWVTRLRGYYCPDRGYLCTVVKLLPNKVETISYDALLAITVARNNKRHAVGREAMIGLPGELASCIDDDLPSYWGKVSLRGNRGYRLARRWFAPSLTRVVIWE